MAKIGNLCTKFLTSIKLNYFKPIQTPLSPSQNPKTHASPKTDNDVSNTANAQDKSASGNRATLPPSHIHQSNDWQSFLANAPRHALVELNKRWHTHRLMQTHKANEASCFLIG